MNKLLAPLDLLEGTSQSARAKTAETFLEALGSARAQFPIREALIGWPSAHSWLFERLSSGMFLMNYPREIRRFKGALLPLFDPCFAANNFAETLKLGDRNPFVTG
jgi:hypothetical protein